MFGYVDLHTCMVTTMSRFYIPRMLDRWVDRRNDYCLETYKSFIHKTFCADMTHLNLGAFNRDMCRVEVVRWDKYSFNHI